MFAAVGEASISRAILREFNAWFDDYIVSDVVIVGAGPSGLVAARDLAHAGLKTLVIESNNYLGGGFWVGGYFLNTLTFRAPGNEILDELRIPYKKVEEGLYISDGPTACSKLIAAACDAGVKILNLTKFDDVVVRNGRVEGVVINWAPVSALPRQITCVDPIALETRVVVDATGHDAWVAKSLEKRGLLKVLTFGPMDVVGSEDMVVEKTGEVYPGLMVSGMAAATVFGIPRMGPTFSGMLFSGRKIARQIISSLKAKKQTSKL
ncbi:MAG TPA: sulfide-dependent adenosine diphosphate thiazole synthase [Candidatus Omnitrophota bacterium]|nr:sulfide-dependent adenosine diphosphate thiazole synthase [Candidatus Omnitrophota bacterium]HPT08034.1 sulfide-dependent adenosine diphosphate thiazole synthase [Candidatus Omnitrophota bacterium]